MAEITWALLTEKQDFDAKKMTGKYKPMNIAGLALAVINKLLRKLTFYGRRTMKIVKNLIKKIVYVFISINQDIKQRYEIQKEFESSISQSKNVKSR